jgi:hypothetical protein
VERLGLAPRLKGAATALRAAVAGLTLSIRR